MSQSVHSARSALMGCHASQECACCAVLCCALLPCVLQPSDADLCCEPELPVPRLRLAQAVQLLTLIQQEPHSQRHTGEGHVAKVSELLYVAIVSCTLSVSCLITHAFS
jgi:hypothetical protein